MANSKKMNAASRRERPEGRPSQGRLNTAAIVLDIRSVAGQFVWTRLNLEEFYQR
jgi:hypothetical protein